jgi:hypothetical protein
MLRMLNSWRWHGVCGWALMAGCMALLSAPRASAVYFTYNGAVVITSGGKPRVSAGGSLVVSPSLDTPYLLKLIIRRQGTINTSQIRLVSTSHQANWTFNVGGPGQITFHGSYKLRPAGNGSRVLVNMGAAKATYYLQEGAASAQVQLLAPSGSVLLRQNFNGIVKK